MRIPKLPCVVVASFGVLAGGVAFAGEGGGKPVPIDVVYTLGDASCPPGGSVAVPFYLRSEGAGGVRGYSFSVDFDEEILRATRVEMVWDASSEPCTEGGFNVFRFNNDNRTPGNAGVDEGFLYGGVVYCFSEHVVLPSATEVEILRLHFDVSPAAPEGTTMVRFLDGALQGGDPKYPVNNLVTIGSETELQSVPPELASSFLLLDCELVVANIVIDIALFRRGDVDGDGRINMTDPVRALNYLFLGGETPDCLDAGDTDDDGKILISDSIYLLNHLFLGGPAPLPPYPAVGEDPTEDELRCRRS